MLKKSLRLAIIFFIVICTFFYVFKDVSIDELLNALKSLHYIYLLPAVFVVALSFLFRAIRWRYIIASVKEVKTKDLLSPLMIGFMGNMLPARAGEFIRAYLLGNKENMSFSAAFATVFIEKLFDLFFVMILLSWALIFKSNIIAYGDTGANYNLMDFMVNFLWISLIGCLFILLLSIFLLYKNELSMKTINACIKFLPDKWGEAIHRMVHSFAEGLKIMKDLWGFIAVIIHSIIIFCLLALTFYLLYLAFGINTELPVLLSLVLLILIIDIFIALFPTPGFLGSFHAACVATLHGIFGISKAVALSYGIVAWLVLMGFTIVGGTIFVIIDNIHLRDISSKKKLVP